MKKIIKADYKHNIAVSTSMHTKFKQGTIRVGQVKKCTVDRI